MNGHLSFAPGINIVGEAIPRWMVCGHPIMVGGQVGSAADWSSLQELGVTDCISVTDPPDVGVPDEALLHVPFTDEGHPVSALTLDKIRTFAARCFATRGVLYVHCWVGASRSPSMAYAILRAERGLSRAEALAAIQVSYPYGVFGQDPKHQRYMASVESWLRGER